MEHLFDDEEDEPVRNTKKPSAALPNLNNGELPSFMKPTKSFEAAITTQQSNEDLLSDQKPKRKSTAENGSVSDIKSRPTKSQHSDSSDIPQRTSSLNGELPSFMKPTKNFEIRDKHNEIIFPAEEPPAAKHAPKRRPVSVLEGDTPSYMKATKSHELREHAIATHAPEPDSLEMALKRPMIDEPDSSATAVTLSSKKKSVGGFLKRKFGLGGKGQ